MTSGYDGMAVFTTPGTYTVTVPLDCTGVLVELWGAGGGGGGHDEQTANYPPPAGGLGASGAYLRGVAHLDPALGTDLTITVGAGGAGGGQGENGADGTATEVLQGTNVLARAEGGSAGSPVADGTFGFDGTPGTAEVPGGGGEAYPGNQRPQFALVPAAASGGTGGFWNLSASPQTATPGLDGRAVIIW